MDHNEQLSLSWDAHQKSICNGLSLLQQRGEFVDMTLAADGHHVKVHQLVLSLVSPYIKDLISTAQCPHPVIFLNNISYSTLCAILEYIYTGEVHVPKDKLPDLLAAGKALHVRGLKEMNDNQPADPKETITTHVTPPRPKSLSEKLRAIREKKRAAQTKEEKKIAPPQLPMCKIYLDETKQDDSSMQIEDSSIYIEDECTAVSETTFDAIATSNDSDSDLVLGQSNNSLTLDDTRKLSQKVEFSVTTQGGLQVIHNRFIYHLRYFAKKNRKRLWRCIDYSNNLKCPAAIFTDENGRVMERSFTHNHGFHDNKILKKFQNGIIYSMFKDAINKADGKKKERHVPVSASTDLPQKSESADDTE